ncbi:MAG: MFS transporter [Chloroflexi bacterium]|nr:MFS transporter [Chloroflexota bacterium]
MTSTTDPPAISLPRVARTPFYYGWVILAVAALANFTSAPGQTYTFSVFQNSFLNDLHLSSTAVSTLYLFGSLTAAVIIIFIGRYLDRLGPRVMLVIVTIFLGLGALWLSQINFAWQLYVGFAIMRTMGQGALSLIPATVVSVWFVRKRPMALAIMALGGALASGVFPIYGATLIDAFGWRTAWVAIAITVWVLLIIPAIIFMRTTPESIGLRPDGDSTETDHNLLSSIGSAKKRFIDSERSWTLGEAIHSRALWVLIFAGTAQSLVGTGVMFHQVSIITSKGLTASTAAGVFGIIAPMLIAGQFLGSYLASRIELRYLLAAGQVVIIIAMLILMNTTQLWQAYLYGAVLGINMGFLMNINQVVWPSYFGRKHLGSIRGVTNFGMMSAAALGPLPLALALDITGNSTAGLIAYMTLPPLCGVAALFAGNPRALPKQVYSSR